MQRPIDFPPAVWSALEAEAARDGTSVTALLREAVDRELYRRQRARKAERPDERLIAPLRALLAEDFAYSRGWEDLQRRLGGKGYQLAESGPGLILADLRTGLKVAKASDLGYSHARLTGRFGRPFPAHAHGHVVSQSRLGQPWP